MLARAAPGFRRQSGVLILAAIVAVGCSPTPTQTPGASSASSATASPTTPPSSRAPAPTLPTSGDWPVATPESEGFDSALIARGIEAFGAADGVSALHSLLLVRHDRLFLEAYLYPYDGSTYHDIRSVTKSVTTTLVGIAAGRGLLNLDAPMVSFFKDRTMANRDARKERITVRHLASMTSGLDCTVEQGERTLLEMVTTRDFVQFALDLPMAYDPGDRFSYCSPGMHVLSAILTAAAGKSEADFAREVLFGPLGITDFSWPADAQGYSYGWSELALHPRDLAKLGLLFAHGGKWNDQQVVPASWVAAATQRQVGAGFPFEEDYGYGWWVSRPGEVLDSFRASGDLGQRIIVVPAKDWILVANGGGFELDDVTDFLLGAVTNSWQPLPEDTAAVGQLDAIVARARAGPACGPVPSLPPLAAAISSRRAVFGSALPISWLSVDFVRPTEATVAISFANEPVVRTFGVGLDGRFKPSRSGRPLVARGAWTAADTLEIEIDEGPGIAPYRVRLTYEGDAVRLRGLSVSGETRLDIVGHMER
ncbi:MAG TPA: serine hydrolase [Candidatus Limnocylindrales bacterium]|nr:serine hydrolase [Candidatus Limnocylindrales bacterium]